MISEKVKLIKFLFFLILLLNPAFINAQSGSIPYDRPESSSKKVNIGNQNYDFTSPLSRLEKLKSGPVEVFPKVITDKPIDATKYMVGVGDKLVLVATGKMDANIFLTVGPEGKVILPDSGSLNVAGLTLKKAEEEISKKMKRRYPRVSFELLLVEPRSFKVYVLGEVSNPGIHVLTSLERVSDSINRAGGLKRSGTKRNIEIRRSGKVILADLHNFLMDGNLEANPFLIENDIIFIPLSSPKVTIGGGIRRPGVYELEGKESLRHLIKRVGGLSFKVSYEKPLKIIRVGSNYKKKTLEFKLKQILDSKDKPIELIDGDNIFIPSVDEVPPNEINVYVTGEVKKPGAYAYVPGFTAKTYVGLAGGLTQRARYSQAKIIKSNGNKLELSDDTVLEIGDTVHIPERFIKVWQDCLIITTSISSLTLAVIAAFK